MENRRIKKIESIFMTVPTMCCSCGKEIEDKQMWEVTYFNYLNNKFDPYYCCYECMPTYEDVIEAFGATNLNTKEETFTQRDFLSLFIAILRIKENYTFNCNTLNQLIRIKLQNNEYNRILSNYNTKNFYKALKEQINIGNITTTIKNNELTVHINKKINIKTLLEEKLDYLEEIINFTEKYKLYEKIENRNKIYEETLQRKNKKTLRKDK